MQVTHSSGMAPLGSKKSRFDPLGNAMAADMNAKMIKSFIFGENGANLALRFYRAQVFG